MRSKRLFEGPDVIFDAEEILDGRKHKGKVVVKMKRGPLSYVTPEGVTFYKTHPFQWVSAAEAETLIGLEKFDSSIEFVPSNKREIEDYYSE